MQLKAPGEWSRTQLQRRDSLAAEARRRSPALQSKTTQSNAGSAPERVPASAAGDVAGGANARPATEAEGERFLIEEWRRSELDVADSVHHMVLLRLSRLYDSAQGRSISTDDRLRILRDVDGVNAANQVMWFERRTDVNRMADSTERAAGLPTRH